MRDNSLYKQRYRILLDTDDYVVITTPDRTITFANEAYCNVAGMPLSEVTGKNFLDSFTDETRSFYSGFISHFTVAGPTVFTIQRTGIAGDEEWISWRETAVFDEKGVLIEIVSVGKAVDKEVGNKKGRLLATLTAFKTAIDTNLICTITDDKGIIIYANEKFCSIAKFTKEELLGKTHHIVNSGYHSRDFFNGMWRTISAGQMWTGDIKNKAKDGTFYWVESVIVPIKNEEARVSGYLSIRILIDQRKQMEEERENYVRSVNDMLHIVSHELRKPITACQGLLNMLQQDTTMTRQEYDEIIGHLIASASELDAYSRKLNETLHNNIKV